jgi:hypothetical protein
MHKPNLAFHFTVIRNQLKTAVFLGFCSGIAEDSVLLRYDTTAMKNQTLM